MAPDNLMEIDNDATMTDNIKESDPFIDLLKGIFDTNNDLSRVEMFKNLLVQKLWKTFAQTQVYEMYLHSIKNRYGVYQFRKLELERSRILDETDFDIFHE